MVPCSVPLMFSSFLSYPFLSFRTPLLACADVCGLSQDNLERRLRVSEAEGHSTRQKLEELEEKHGMLVMSTEELQAHAGHLEEQLRDANREIVKCKEETAAVKSGADKAVSLGEQEWQQQRVSATSVCCVLVPC